MFFIYIFISWHLVQQTQVHSEKKHGRENLCTCIIRIRNTGFNVRVIRKLHLGMYNCSGILVSDWLHRYRVSSGNFAWHSGHLTGLDRLRQQPFLTETGYSHNRHSVCGFAYTVEPVLKDHLIGHKNVVCQDRWSLVTGSVILKCRSFCKKCVVFSRLVVSHGGGLSR